MLTLSIMTEQELNQIFGTLDSLIPLHEGTVKPLMMSHALSLNIDADVLMNISYCRILSVFLHVGIKLRCLFS